MIENSKFLTRNSNFFKQTTGKEWLSIIIFLNFITLFLNIQFSYHQFNSDCLFKTLYIGIMRGGWDICNINKHNNNLKSGPSSIFSRCIIIWMFIHITQISNFKRTVWLRKCKLPPEARCIRIIWLTDGHYIAVLWSLIVIT